ncbi:MAG TPA: hypothetical protein VMZ53_12850 [Kofleriaceae bacterium]|nr:hypothetical protein [Kofleriaceae bacterium]
MGPWTRTLVTVHIVCTAEGKLTAEVTAARTPRYPRRPADPAETKLPASASKDSTIASADELIPWLGSLGIDEDDLAHVRIVPFGTPAQRAALIALPWHKAIAGAVVSVPRGKRPTRSQLRIPVVISSSRDKQFLDERIDSFVDATKASKTGTQGDIVLAVQGDAIGRAVGTRTRLVVIETDAIGAPPDGAFNVVQLSGPPQQRVEFVQRLLRAIFHDAPLDAAVLEGMRAAKLEANHVRFDLLEGDEECLRLSHALKHAATSMKHAKPFLPKNGGGMPKAIPIPPPVAASPLESMAGPLDGWADHLSSTADNLDFTHEIHGANATADVLGQAGQASDVAEAATAAADEIELDRSAQLWLEDEVGDVVAAETPLKHLGTYWLNFQIAKDIKSHATAAKLPSEELRILFEKKDKLDLDIVLYADPDKLRIEGHRFELTLQRWGATQIIRTTLKPLECGIHQVRACVYYKGNMLQSLAMQVGVECASVPAHVDYTGIETFRGIMQLPQVAYSLWINDTEDKHWIGVYATQDALGDLDTYDLKTPATKTVDKAVAPARKALALLEGDDGNNSSYLFSPSLPTSDALTQKQHELFVELAKEGYRMFTALMQPSETPDNDYIPKLKKRLSTPDQILSIARLDDESSVPWALMYDQRIDPADPGLQLCTRFQRERADGTKLVHSPADCRAQADCPLASKATLRKTVCPFGFWGFRHQVELRLRNQSGGTNAVDRTRISASPKPRAASAMFEFAESKEHLKALASIIDTGEALRDRDKILDALREGNRSLYYFFCHADQDNVLHLRIADGQLIEPASIAARSEAEDDGWELATWDAQRPLVFLNACESLALDAQVISPFLDKFLGLGASGLVGTEVKVFTELAAGLATELLTRMVKHRESLGAALLHVRREMLGNGNPMGLAYSVYGSAALHFHLDDCACGGPG